MELFFGLLLLFYAKKILGAIFSFLSDILGCIFSLGQKGTSFLAKAIGIFFILMLIGSIFRGS